MTIGFIGLGRMGYSMVERMLRHKIKVIAYNRSPGKIKSITKKGAIPAFSVKELVGKVKGKKIVWIMLPAGKATDDMIRNVLPLLSAGDILIDGANDFYKNAEKHDKWCRKQKVHFFDIGVSGGVWGLKNGYTLMVGGPKNQFRYIEKYCKALAPKKGYGLFGTAGAGHFVKSVHNIIEYVYLQGLAEGVEILNKFKRPIDIKKATTVWRPASVINSWLLDLADTAIKKPGFKNIGPEIGSVTIGELKNTVKSVKAHAPAFDVATKIRQDKSKKFVLGKRVIAAIRYEFGGHAVKKKKK